MSLERLKLLHIDDEELRRREFAEWLTESGVTFDQASNEPTALDLLQRNKYNVVLSDTYHGMEPYGPEIMRKAENLGIEPIIIAYSAFSLYTWRDHYDHSVNLNQATQDIKDELQKTLQEIHDNIPQEIHDNIPPSLTERIKSFLYGLRRGLKDE